MIPARNFEYYSRLSGQILMVSHVYRGSIVVNWRLVRFALLVDYAPLLIEA